MRWLHSNYQMADFKGGHDAFYVHRCTHCAGKKLNTEADSYCTECGKLFCDACAKNHDAFTKGHRLLKRKDVAKWGKVTDERTTFECEQHPGKELEMYCVDDDSLCCSICVHLKHRLVFCLQ